MSMTTNRTKRKRAIILLTALVLLASIVVFILIRHHGAGLYAGGRAVAEINIADEVARRFANYGEVDFDEIADFAWDMLLIIRPYADLEQIFDDEGIKWVAMNTRIRHFDWVYLLVFVERDVVVHYFELDRGVADFVCYEGFASCSYIALTRANARFVSGGSRDYRLETRD